MKNIYRSFLIRKTISLQFFILAILSQGTTIAQNISHDADDPHLTWANVEVVTNKVEVISTIRNLTKIKQGDSFKLSDPRLPNACDQVRKKFPKFKTSCTVVLMSEATALYVVQTVTSPNKATIGNPPCNKRASLHRDLSDLADKITHDTTVALLQKEGNAEGELINENQVLDYLSPMRHDLSMAYAKLLDGRADELAVAAKSCNSTARANAIFLLNYAGNAKKALKSAAPLLNDPDDTVRNNALRLIGSFSKFINNDDGVQYAITACARLDQENFFDRNKGLLILSTLSKNNVINLAKLKPQCVARISELAVYSQSDQIGTQAKELIAKIK